MRLATFETKWGPQVGVVNGDSLVPVAAPGLDMIGLIAASRTGLEQARTASGPAVALSSVTLLAPIPMPRRNILCVGVNYAAHAAEGAGARGMPVQVPERPLFFTKNTTTANGPHGDIPHDPAVSDQLDWEVELGVVIGQGGKNIPEADAMRHVFGYLVVNDVSARDAQVGHGGQFFKGKSLDGTCPMGPWIVTADEIADPHKLGLRCRVNGVVKQDANTEDMMFRLPALIMWLSKGMTLLPGDILATGTPSGVGFARKPPEFLHPGDVVECEVDGIGSLRNRVVSV